MLIDPVTAFECQVRNSGKFKLLAELLPSLKKDGHRPLLFSQWTSVRSGADLHCFAVKCRQA